MSQALFNLNVTRRIQSANYCYFQEGVLHPDRTMKVHDFIYLMQGAWEIYENNTRYLMTPGSVLMLSSHQHHFGKLPCQKNTRTMYFHIYEEKEDVFLDDRYSHKPTEGLVTIPTFSKVGRNPIIRRLFEEIVHLSWSSKPTNRMLARIKVSELITKLHGYNENGLPSIVDPVNYVIDLIEQNPSNEVAIDKLAEKLNISRRALTLKFKEKTGTSIKQFQIHLRLTLAAELLKNHSLVPIKQIAEQYSFYDEFHFSKLFKKQTGLTPSEYRKKSIKK